MMNADTVWNDAWDALEKAPLDKHHDFNTAVIGSYNENFGADLRTVVLRKAIPEKQELWFYTDNRSGKMKQLISSGKISWLFYDRKEKVQLRFYGDVEICTQSAETRKIWNSLSYKSKLAYLAEPGPGIAVPKPDDGLDDVADIEAVTEKGYAHFTLIKTAVTKLDWLELADDAHRRICYQRNGNKWLSDWLIP